MSEDKKAKILNEPNVQKVERLTCGATKKMKPILSHPCRVFGFEVCLFAATLMLGILAGLRLKEILGVQEISLQPVSVWQVLLPFILGTLVLLFVIYFLKFKKVKGVFFKILFSLAIGFGDLFFFGLWLPDILVFPLVAGLIILLLKKSFLMVHNFALIFGIAGIGAGLGLRLQSEVVILLLVIFSIYDFIAVYKTKHMVKMAKEMLQHKAIVGFIIPQKLSDFSTQLKKVKVGGRFLILGGGDIVFPLILAVSLIPQSTLHALIIAFFSVIGLFAGFLIFISQKTRAPMPALPPIALFSILGYLLTKVL